MRRARTAPGRPPCWRRVAGLRPRASAGALAVAGDDWPTARRPPERARRPGLPGPLLFPHLDALANVAFGRGRGAPPARTALAEARSWLDRLGVAELADAPRPAALSGGQAQRVALARALATEPAAAAARRAVRRTGRRRRCRAARRARRHLAAFAGCTLLVTHDALDALALADRVVVLEDGRIAQDGTPTEVAAAPATDHVARLLGLNVFRRGRHERGPPDRRRARHRHGRAPARRWRPSRPPR